MNRWLAPAFLAAAWLLGTAAAAFTGGDPAASLAASGLLGALSFARWPRPLTLCLVAAGTALIFAAAWRYDDTTPKPSPVAAFNCDGSECKDIRLRAVVDAEPDDRASSRLYRLQVRQAFVEGHWRAESGRVLMRAALYPDYEYGDLLEIRGKLEAPPEIEDFDYRDYLLRRGIGSVVDYPDVRLLGEDHGSGIRSALFDVRSRLSRSLKEALPEPEAALAAGILFGTRSEIPKDLKDDMNATGTSHMVAVSGQNVVLAAGFVIAALAWLVGRRNAAWIALVAIICYAILVGGQPSVVRGAAMGGLYVMAIAVGRQNSALIALILAGAGITALDPQVVREVSFQLSFAATLGLILMTPVLSALIDRALAVWPAIRDFPLTNMLLDITTMTIAATAFTLPIIAINFERVSLVTPLANLFAVPAFFAVAATAALTVIVNLLLPGDAGFMGWLAWVPAAYMIAVIRFFADLPVASFELQGISVGHAVLYYAALLAGMWWLNSGGTSMPDSVPRAQSPSRRLVPASALALVLGLSSVLLWLTISAPTHGRLTVTFLDVGQGEAILIESPQGHRILVDGGPSADTISSALSRHLPFYDRRIDLVILTHPQADHIGGLPEVVEHYDVGAVLQSPVKYDSAAYDTWTDSLKAASVLAEPARLGQRIDLGQGAEMTVLSAAPMPTASKADVNSGSVVLKLTFGDVSFLLTADADKAAEERLLRSGTDLEAAVLKVGHHGSSTSTTSQFLRRVQPYVDVISVGEKNRYGHPAPEVLERLADDLILRTDLHGDITVSTDGRRLWVQTQRQID